MQHFIAFISSPEWPKTLQKKIQEQVALVSGSYEAALASEYRGPDRLSTMPPEILIEIIEKTVTLQDKFCLVLTSKYLYQILDKHLYRASGEARSWLPVFLAARKGDMAMLNKCKGCGAPADISWDREHDGAWVSPGIQHGASPLDEAIMNLQVEAVRWFLAQGTSPSHQKGPCSPLIRAFWMERKNTIAGLPAAQRRTHRNRYSTFAMEKLRVRGEKARRIIDLLLGAGATLIWKEAAWFDPILAKVVDVAAKIDRNWGAGPGNACVCLLDPNSVTLSGWLAIAQVLGFPR